MFVALEIIQKEPGGVFGRLRGMLVKPKLWLETGECAGAHYALLRVEASGRRDRIDWRAVERICGSYRNKLLLPEGLEPPIETGLVRPELRRFNDRVFQHTACEVIAQTRMPMYKRVLGFIDREAKYSHMLNELLRHYTSVRVVTDNLDRYHTEAERLLEELGAPVVVGTGLDSLAGCVLILSPGAFYTSQAAAFSCPVVAGDVFVAGGRCDLVTALRTVPGEPVRSACPAGIDPHDFAGALYEFCSADISTFLAERLLYNYRAAALPELVAAVARGAGLEHPYYLAR